MIVRVTADCPMIDPDEIDRVIQRFFDSGADFAANRLPPPYKRTSPIGMDTEVCSFAALERAWREADQAYQREHVMPYLYDQEGRFKVAVVDRQPDLGGHLRFTVDTPADLQQANEIYAALATGTTSRWRNCWRKMRKTRNGSRRLPRCSIKIFMKQTNAPPRRKQFWNDQGR